MSFNLQASSLLSVLAFTFQRTFDLVWRDVLYSRLLTPPCFSSGVGSPFRARAFVTEAYWDRFSVNLDLFVKQELYNSYRELGGFPQLFEIINESCGRESSVEDE